MTFAAQWRKAFDEGLVRRANGKSSSLCGVDKNLLRSYAQNSAAMWIDKDMQRAASDGGYEGQVFSGVINDPGLDRYETVIHPSGCRSENFEKNPVVFYDHGWYQNEKPIGRCVALTKDATKIEALFVLASDDENAERIANLINQKILRSLSISWSTLRYHWEDAPAVDMHGQPTTKRILHYDEWELLEFSVVGIPGNPNCLMNQDGGARFATPHDEVRSAAARIYDLLVKGKVTPDQLRRDCGRIMAIFGLDENNVALARDAIEFQKRIIGVAELMPDGDERTTLASAILACIEE